MNFIEQQQAIRAQSLAVSPESTDYTEQLIAKFKRANIAENVRDEILKTISVAIQTKGYASGIDDVRWSYKLNTVRKESVPTANKATLDHFVQDEVERGWLLAMDTLAQPRKFRRAKIPAVPQRNIRCGYDVHESRQLDQSDKEPKYIEYVQPAISVAIWCSFSPPLA